MERLTGVQGRVVGCLIEKQLTTPQQYPLSLNTLVAACNQSSNREPVTAYADSEVLAALEDLKAAKLVRFVLPSHGRSVVRYRHVLDEVFGIDEPQLAVLALLVLRGPQTAGELRVRVERMAELESVAAVEHELELLAGLDDPLAERLERRPGQKEERWADRLAVPLGPVAPASSAPAAGPGSSGGAAPDHLWASVEAELSSLRSEVAALRAEVDDLRQSLGG